MSFESQDIDTGDDDRKRDSSRKRDGKREKREKGYQMFEAEDSDDETFALAEDLKSPSKQKKERAKPTFKFPVRKEKTKEKEDKKDKEAKAEEKEKKKEEKEKKKHKKDKKKSKHGHQDPTPAIATPSVTENPIFGVPLATAVERNRSHDGIELPALVRECIDYIEEFGLACEGIYRLSGVKSKVQHLKDCYNCQEPVHLLEHEPNVVASLLKLFLRELPEPVLTTALMPKFEEASTIKNKQKKIEAFIRVIADLPTCNRLLLSWMIVHMTHVIELAKENKMSLQNVSIVLSPTMQISHRVLNVLFSNVSELFGDVQLRRYVPPLKPAHSKWCLDLPDNLTALEEELAKQESLLNQLHAELHSGKEDPEISEQLWEVQRVVTQLKRKIKMGKKNVELAERRRSNMDAKRSSNSSLPSLSAPEELQLDLRPAPTVGATTVITTVEVETHPTEKADAIKRLSKEIDKVKDSAHQSVKGSKESGADASKDIGANSAEGTEAADGEAGSKDSSKQGAEVDSSTKRMSDPKNASQDCHEPQSIEESSTKSSTGKGSGEGGKPDAVVKSTKEEKVEEKQAFEAAGDKTADSKDEEKEAMHKSKDATQEQEEKASEAVEIRETSKKVGIDRKSSRESFESKESEGEKTIQKEERKFAQEEKVATVEEGPRVIQTPPTPTGASFPPESEQKQTSEALVGDKKDNKKSVKFAEEKKFTPEKEEKLQENVEESEAKKTPPVPSTQNTTPKEPPLSQEKPKPKKYEYRKPPNPPFVSTSLLKPMKAEPPKPRPVADKSVEEESPQQETERWRELEEELLGRGDEEEVERLLEEEYALKLEEEELLAIGFTGWKVFRRSAKIRGSVSFGFGSAMARLVPTVVLIPCENRSVLHNIRKLVLKQRETELGRKADEINNAHNGHSMFKAVEELNKKQQENLKVEDTNGKLAINPNDTLNIIASFFKEKFQSETATEIEAFTGSPRKLHQPSTKEENKKSFNNLNNNRAPGEDGIHAELLKTQHTRAK
ncbi:RalA-binding protein 1 [Elysia marginata]|uniref:RalA-binding protein 1 n=1 Tax=Elysia marginata TaxID=1093978 RepID=A0AAV4JD53_9GAST|nr:RalA-binding protein 1 [Elysia marginata]